MVVADEVMTTEPCNSRRKILSIEENKAVVRKFFADSYEHSQGGKFTRLKEFLTDDCSWWIIGDTTVSGMHYPVDEFMNYANTIFAEAASPYSFTVYEMTGEGNLVSMTGKGHLIMKKTGLYSSDYNFFFEFRDGKICRIREYLDSQHFVDLCE